MSATRELSPLGQQTSGRGHSTQENDHAPRGHYGFFPSPEEQETIIKVRSKEQRDATKYHSNKGSVNSIRKPKRQSRVDDDTPFSRNYDLGAENNITIKTNSEESLSRLSHSSRVGNKSKNKQRGRENSSRSRSNAIAMDGKKHRRSGSKRAIKIRPALHQSKQSPVRGSSKEANNTVEENDSFDTTQLHSLDSISTSSSCKGSDVGSTPIYARTVTRRQARAIVVNETGESIRYVTLIHKRKYSDKFIEKTSEHDNEFIPASGITAPLIVTYQTGPFASARDWWYVSWFSEDMETYSYSNPPKCRVVGFQQHILTAEDEGTAIQIILKEGNQIEIKSNSYASTTQSNSFNIVNEYDKRMNV